MQGDEVLEVQLERCVFVLGGQRLERQKWMDRGDFLL